MVIQLNEILSIYKPDDLNAFIKKYSGFTLDEKNLTYEKIAKTWKFVGDNPSNASVINILKYPEKGIIERITNGIDAVLEKQKKINKIDVAKTANDIVSKAFPRFYQNKIDVISNMTDRLNACEASDTVVVAINDSTKSNKPTIDIIDQGLGICGDNFESTILSINKGNKLSSDKNYLIGAFGQGGSTSLPFSFATIILSKQDDKYYFTIIKRVELSQYKNYCFVYLNLDGKVLEATNNYIGKYDEYIQKFLNSDSGTMVRMIESEISREYRVNDISKPGMLGDYVNTELFNVSLPVKMIENRKDYTSNMHAQSRNSFGSLSKMQTWKYIRKELSGSISVLHNEKSYKIDYYFMLPEDENKWASDSECKNIFRQINVHLDPIIYTVNGQYVSSEKFLKLKNVGLSFLQYRLLVEINLDVLGTEKYKFFTSDRSQIQNSDLTRGFLEKIIDTLKNEKTIIEMNDVIANKSINTQINSELITEISNNVKNIYGKYLRSNNLLSTDHGNGHKNTEDEEEIYLDRIDSITVTTTKSQFYKNERINLILTTKAKKSINREAMIYMILDGKAYYNFIPSYMNGRIQYSFSNLNIGLHNVTFEYYVEDTLSKVSNNFQFTVLDQNMVESINASSDKKLNLEIKLVDEKELIVDTIKNGKEHLIEVHLCLNHDLLVTNVYGRTASNDEIQSLKNSLIQPIILFVLFMGDQYDKIEENSKKNELIVSFTKTLTLTLKNR